MKLTDKDQSESMRTVMSHDFGIEGETQWETVSIPLPPMTVRETDNLKLQLRAIDDPHSTPAGAGERARLLAEIHKSDAREEDERRAEVARPAVLADAAARARRQQDIVERLRKLREKEKSDTRKRRGRCPLTSHDELGIPGVNMVEL